MATFVATRAGVTRPTVNVGWANDSKTQWGAIAITAKPSQNDVFQMLRLPKGALVYGGRLRGDKIDSSASGSASLQVNIGFDKAVVIQGGTNAGVTVTASSTSNALASTWSLGPDAAAVTGYKPDADVRNLPLGSLLLTDGPLLTTDETVVSVTIVTSCLALTTGDMILEVDYYMSQHV